MSHAYGLRCKTHGSTFIGECPEGCGVHGYTDIACNAHCPQWDGPRTFVDLTDPGPNTHYGVISCSVPPGMEVIAHGPEEFCRTALATWVAEHPLDEYCDAEVLAKTTASTKETLP